MEKRELLVSQKDELFRLVQESGLDLFCFSWTVAQSRKTSDLWVSKLEYDGGSFYYQFDFSRGKHYGILAPGSEAPVATANPGSWEHQLKYFQHWLSCLHRELTTPDLWASLSKYSLPAGEFAEGEFGDGTFTPAEADSIMAALARAREDMVSRFDLTSEQIALLDQKLDYLVGASKRQTRRDWAHLCVAVVFTIAVGLGLTQDDALMVWESVKSALSSVGRLLLK